MHLDFENQTGLLSGFRVLKVVKYPNCHPSGFFSPIEYQIDVVKLKFIMIYINFVVCILG